jgi:hypothetical protein
MSWYARCGDDNRSLPKSSGAGKHFPDRCRSRRIPCAAKSWPPPTAVSAHYRPAALFTDAPERETPTETTVRQFESLEPRRLLASFTASSVADLISDIKAANTSGGANTITLVPGTTFKLNAVDNDFGGPTGLPVIAAGNSLTIVGNATTIQRNTATGTPAFRLFGVATGASLTLANLTLSNGVAFNPSVMSSGEGGAIASDGTLNLTGVTVQNCLAQGQIAYPAFGGGIYSVGVLTVADCAILNNQASAGSGSSADMSLPLSGSTALGGGVCVAGGTATLTNTRVSSNVARGGDGANGGKVRGKEGSWMWGGGSGGDGLGGGIYVADNATVTLRGTTVTQNAAMGGTGGSAPKGLPKGADGAGRGGGLYIVPTAAAGLDAFTQANTRTNTASTSDNDIFGSFSILS